MADLSDILRLEDRILEFARDIEVFAALEEIVTTYKDNRPAISNLGVTSAIEFVNALATDQAFFDALTALGIGGGQLQDVVTTVSESLGKLTDKQRKLLQPLSDFDEQRIGGDPGLVSWQILDAGKTGGVDTRFVFDLKGAVELALEAGDTWPRPADAIDENFLRLGVNGSLGASGNASIPLSSGSLKVGTSNRASASLDFYYRPMSESVFFAGAVAARLDELPNPFDLDSVWRQLAQSDLNGIVAKVDGSTSLNVEVAIAEGFTIAEELATGTAGLTVGATVSCATDYELVLRALPGSASESQILEATLMRNALRERGRNLELGVEVDLSGLASRLRDILKRHQGSFKEILEKYEDYLTPGTYLRMQLASRLDSRIDSIVSKPAVRDSLKEAFEAALGRSRAPTLSKLKELLSGRITDEIDQAAEVITGKANVVAREVVSRIAAYLGIDASDIIQPMVTDVTSLVEDVQSDLKEKIDALSERQTNRLLNSLKDAGATVSSNVARADAALAGVREVIGKYENLLKRLIDETENAARTRITAKLMHEETHTSGKVIEVQMFISAHTAASAAAFDTLISGDMDGIVKLLQRPIPGVDFDRENMALSRYASMQRKTGLEVVFLNFEFGTQSIFDTDSQVTSDGAGRVSVKTSATWRKHKFTPREKRELQFVDAFELAAAKATRLLSVNLDISHKDEMLEQHEVASFLASFESAGLLPQGTTERAVDVFIDWAGSGEDKKIKADIDLSLRLDDKGSRRLMRLSDRMNGDLSETARMRVFSIALRELIESGAYDDESLTKSAQTVLTLTRMGDSMPRNEIIYNYNRTLHRKTVNVNSLHSPANAKQRRLANELNRISRVNNLCTGFANFVDTMGDIYEATPSLGEGSGWTEEDYLDAQRKLNSQIKNWLKIKSKMIFWIDDEAHPRTVAFVGGLMALAATASEEGPGAQLSLTITRQDGTAGEVTLA